VTFIILKAREYDMKEADSDPDFMSEEGGSNATDDGQTDVLVDKPTTRYGRSCWAPSMACATTRSSAWWRWPGWARHLWPG